MANLRGTLAPDVRVLRQLAAAAGDPLRLPDTLKGSMLDTNLMRAAASAGGHCVYLPEVWCKQQDRQALEALALDVAAAHAKLVPHRTQKRMQIFAEDLQDSKVFSPLLGRMLSAFGGLALVDAWVNVYRDGGETTGAHNDHYNLRTPHAGATLNLNLGATRYLCLEHMETGRKFYVPQENGSLFAFDANFNAAFRHSIPSDRNLPAEPDSLRLSITAFAMVGPQPASVQRDVGNVPTGVPLQVSWTGWDLSDAGWCQSRRLPTGVGPQELLSIGSLMRGHQKGKGKGGRGGKGGGPKGAYVAADQREAKAEGEEHTTKPGAEGAVVEQEKAQTKRRWGRGSGRGSA